MLNSLEITHQTSSSHYGTSSRSTSRHHWSCHCFTVSRNCYLALSLLQTEISDSQMWVLEHIVHLILTDKRQAARRPSQAPTCEGLALTRIELHLEEGRIRGLHFGHSSDSVIAQHSISTRPLLDHARPSIS